MEQLFYADDVERMREVVSSMLEAWAADQRAVSGEESSTARTVAMADSEPSMSDTETHEQLWARLDEGELYCWSEDDRAFALAAPRDTALALAFLRGAVERTAQLAASWQASEFVHGMLRSDNLTLCGVALDVGPTSRFGVRDDMDDIPPKEPMYSFDRQPEALAVHMKQLATTLSRLVPCTDSLESELRRFWPTFHAAQADAAIRCRAPGRAVATRLAEVIEQVTVLASACCAGDRAGVDQAREAAATGLCENSELELGRITGRFRCAGQGS